jgi:hypothetical protein
MATLQISSTDARLAVVEIQICVWFVTPCSDAVGYQHFGGLCCLHLQGEGTLFFVQSQSTPVHLIRLCPFFAAPVAYFKWQQYQIHHCEISDTNYGHLSYSAKSLRASEALRCSIQWLDLSKHLSWFIPTEDCSVTLLKINVHKQQTNMKSLNWTNGLILFSFCSEIPYPHPWIAFHCIYIPMHCIVLRHINNLRTRCRVLNNRIIEHADQYVTDYLQLTFETE